MLIKWILCFITGAILTSEIEAQCDPEFIKYTATGITAVKLFDTNRIIAVGQNGSIIKSVDGGKNWKNISKWSYGALYALEFPSDSTGYVIGENRTILKTEDQGENWFSLYSDIISGTRLTDLYFFNKEQGFIVGSGGIFAETNDGGRSWKDTMLSAYENFNSITFINDTTGFICGSSSALYKTTDKGISWQRITLPVSGTFNKVRFIDQLTGFIVGTNGNGICLKTADGGASWTQVITPISSPFGDIHFLNPQTGFIITNSILGSILRTSDGGNNWSVNYGIYGSAYFSSINSDPQRKRMLVTGGSISNSRLIFSSVDTGATYTALSFNGDRNYSDLFCLNDSTVFLIGNDNLPLKSSDFGESWKPLQNVPGNSGNTTQKIFFLDSLHGFASTDNIYKTSDGGKTWIKKTTPGGSSQFFARTIYFADTLTGMVQNSAAVYKTFDGGNSWATVATSQSFYIDLAVTPGGKAFAVGYSGKIDISVDTGTTWNHFDLNTTKSLTSVNFYNDSTGFIGTADSTLFKTTNGGRDWTVTNIQNNAVEVRCVHLINDSVGYMIRAVSGGGITNVYKTKNGGATWNLVNQYGSDFTKLRGFNKTYFAGPSGIILTTDSIKKPEIPGYISGPQKGCLGTSSIYGVGNSYGLSYSWTVDGIPLTIHTNKDTITWSTLGAHTISVTTYNACFAGETRVLYTEVVSFQPVITAHDSLLTATEGMSYQWYINNVPIDRLFGGTSRSYIATSTGNYTVNVKSIYGCSVVSPKFYYVVKQSLCPGGSTTISSSISAPGYQWQQDTGAGFVNISDNGFYSGTQSQLLQLSNVPSSWYEYRYKCSTSYGSSKVIGIRFINKWTGQVNGTWENPSNWSCGQVPDADSDVVIDGGTVVIASDVTIRSLTLDPSVQLTVQPGNALIVTH